MIIYKTTNLLNNKIYVGFQSRDNSDYLGSGVLLKKSIKKYGKENFKRETLENVNDDNWQERERFWIKELNSQDKTIGYNITDGGEGVSSDVAIKLSLKRWESNDQREQHSKIAKKRWESKEQREQHSKILKESCNKEEYLTELRKRCREKPTMKGKHHSNISKQKTSNSLINTWNESKLDILKKRSKSYYMVNNERIEDYEFKSFCENSEGITYGNIIYLLRNNDYNIEYKGYYITKRWKNA